MKLVFALVVALACLSTYAQAPRPTPEQEDQMERTMRGIAAETIAGAMRSLKGDLENEQAVVLGLDLTDDQKTEIRQVYDDAYRGIDAAINAVTAGDVPASEFRRAGEARRQAQSAIERILTAKQREAFERRLKGPRFGMLVFTKALRSNTSHVELSPQDRQRLDGAIGEFEQMVRTLPEEIDQSPESIAKIREQVEPAIHALSAKLVAILSDAEEQELFEMMPMLDPKRVSPVTQPAQE